MMKKYVKLLILLLFFILIEKTTAISIDELPSSELRSEVRSSVSWNIFNSESFDDLSNLSVRQRAYISESALLLANDLTSENRENPAYLYALGIDLYNTVPPEAHEELDEESDWGDHPPGTFKQQIKTLALSNVRQRGTLEESLSYLDNYRKGIQQNRVNKKYLTYLELNYIEYFVLNQVYSGGIVIDDYNAKASFPVENIDLINPTHYQKIKSFQESMQPAIDAGIPPWEAETYLAELRGEPLPVTSIDKSTNIVESELNITEKIDVTDSEEVAVTPNSEAQKTNIYWKYIALLGLLCSIIAYALIRRRKTINKES